jgi:glyoxylase-like metal-dependent hydrolase (beta-lactamase superfamily II)
MIYPVNERIFRIEVRLPNNPLKLLNAYVLKGSSRNLLIDTGFNLPESFEDLSEGIAALGLDMSRTDIFLTHCHADHTGLVPKIAASGTQIYISGPDRERIEAAEANYQANWDRIEEKQLKAGFPPQELKSSMSLSPALRYVPGKRFDMTAIADGDVIDLGDMALRAVFTPGHSPGHMCLYLEKEEIFFLGDHVLFDITPNITDWPEMDDSLADYLDSLKKVRQFSVKLAMPGHRAPGDFHARIEGLLLHHEARLDEACALIRAFPGSTGYEAAARMHWNMRNKTWDEFPLSQKTFAVGEAMSHLYYLEHRGRILSEDRDGVLFFRVTD